jgi:hypothetical protein
VKIVERLTKGESKKIKINKSHEASYIVVEVGGTSTFVTHDVTKVEVRWAKTHLKFKSHAPKERDRLTLRTSKGLSIAQGQRGPWRAQAGLGPGRSHGFVIFSLIFFVFSVFHMFCILVLVFHVVHMYLFETWFSWWFSLFLCSNLRFRNFVQIGSIVDFFFDIYFFQLSFFDFLLKIPFTMHNI